MTDPQGRVELVAALTEAVGASHIGGDEAHVVVRPGAAAEIVRVLSIAESHGLRVSVVEGEGGAAIVVDASRMVNVLHLDETSLLVHVQAGIRLGELERLLRERCLTLGPLPTASAGRMLGAALASPHPSEGTPRGRLLDACVAVDAVLPRGTQIATRMAPRKATGPELAHVLLGARGGTGIITAAWMRLARVAPWHSYAAHAFRGTDGAGGDHAIAVARRLLDRGARPADLAVAAAPDDPGEVAVLVCFDGVEDLVRAELALLAELAREHDGREVSPNAAELWFRHAASEPSPKSEVQVPSNQLEASWRAAVATSGPTGVRLVAFRAAAAALQAEVVAPATALAPLTRLRAALAQQLNPGHLVGRI